MTEKTGTGSVEKYQDKSISQWLKELPNLAASLPEGFSIGTNDEGAMVISYPFKYSTYDNLADAKQGEDWPNDNQILAWVNQTAERSAKAGSYQKAVSQLKIAYEKSPEFRQAQFIASAVAMGFSADEAEALAKSKIS